MEEDIQLDSAVAQKGRISIDVSDLKEEIESCRDDAAWSELPLAAKIRVLVKERLQEIARQNNSLSPKDKAPSSSKNERTKDSSS